MFYDLTPVPLATPLPTTTEQTTATGTPKIQAKRPQGATITPSVGKDTPDEAKLAIALIDHYSELYEVSPKVLKVVAKCESNLRHANIYGDQGRAFGIFQFHRPTFYGFARDMGFSEASYINMDDQIKVAAWAFANGRQNHWTCYTKNFT